MALGYVGTDVRPLLRSRHTVPVRKPKPGELLWTLRKDHRTWSCELHVHGESHGWEAQILRDSELVIGRRFVLREDAVGWAEEEKVDLGNEM